MSVTRQLVEYVCKTTYQDLPQEVVDAAKKVTLDTLGGMVYSSRLPWSKKVVEFVQRSASKGKCTILSFGIKASPPGAALANGTMGHGFELDDVHEGGMLHPGAVVIPAALALGEEGAVDGRRFLLAVAMGYEVVCRVGLGVGAKYHMLKGFHPTGTNGVFGAAAAAGKVMGLSVEKILDAFGISGSLCSGIMQFTHEPSDSGEMIKRLHAGRACEGGVTAALLARGGFRGPSDIIGGKYGYCNVYSDHPQIELTNQELGVRHEILNVGIKPYACCTTMHSIVDAVTQVRKAHRFGSDEIEEIRVGGSQKLVAYSGIYEINSAMAAQYSAPFCVALSLLGDIRNPKRFKKLSPDMKEFKEVMLKTKLYKDDELEALSPSTEGAKVSVVLKNGRSLDAEVMHAKGNPKNPISFDETCEKFAVVTRDRIDAKKRERIIGMIQGLESLSDITKLARLLA